MPERIVKFFNEDYYDTNDRPAFVKQVTDESANEYSY